ncbi:MAG: ABC transporter substrate-binding protein, partial [bacterium]|nr:ABC transporter substrate-binding protein [bacterium]
MRRFTVAAVALLVVCLGTTVVPPAGAQPASGTIVLYTSVPQEMATEFAGAFMRKYPQIKLEVLRSGSTEIEMRIFAEIETGGIRADLLWLA